MGPALFPDLPRVTMTLDISDDNVVMGPVLFPDTPTGVFMSPNVQFANLHDEEEPADESNPLYLDQFNNNNNNNNSSSSGRSESPSGAFMSPTVQFTSLHEEEQPSGMFMSNPLYRELVKEVRHQTTFFDTINVFL